MDHAQRLHPLIKSQRFLESCGRKKQHCRVWEWLRKWHIFSPFSAWVSECIFLQVFKWILFIYSMLAALNRCFFVPFCTVCTVYSWGSLKLDLKELKLQISQNESLYYRRKAPFILHIRLYNQMPFQSIFYLRSCNELITFLFWQMVQ